MNKQSLRNAAILCGLQFLNWSISTISWRSVAQANIPASIAIDSILATLQFWVIVEVAEGGKTKLRWAAFTLGGVSGTIAGIYTSIWLLGK